MSAHALIIFFLSSRPLAYERFLCEFAEFQHYGQFLGSAGRAFATWSADRSGKTGDKRPKGCTGYPDSGSQHTVL
jgi:hypothetical protein